MGAMDPPVTLSPASVRDLEEIMAIEEATFPTPWSLELFRRELDLGISRGLVVRRVEDGTPAVCGYMFFWLVAGEGQLQRVAVRKDLRREGIGDLLMAGMFRVCRLEGVSRIVLEVRRSNEAAAGLYRKWGFRRTGIRRRYYPETGEDAVLMEWNAV